MLQTILSSINFAMTNVFQEKDIFTSIIGLISFFDNSKIVFTLFQLTAFCIWNHSKKQNSFSFFI